MTEEQRFKQFVEELESSDISAEDLQLYKELAHIDIYGIFLPKEGSNLDEEELVEPEPDSSLEGPPPIPDPVPEVGLNPD